MVAAVFDGIPDWPVGQRKSPDVEGGEILHTHTHVVESRLDLAYSLKPGHALLQMLARVETKGSPAE